MKFFLIIPLIICFLSVKSTSAQTASATSKTDAATQTVDRETLKAARKDARSLTLPQDVIAKIKAKQVPRTSDYFKPSAASTSNPARLSDSAYVKSYRYYAYHVAKNKLAHPVRSVLIIVGGAIAAAAIIVVAIVEAHKY